MDSKWNYELIKAEASKYDTKADFRRYSGGAYKFAQRHHILDDLFKYNFWDEESIRKEASKYETKADFRKYNEAAYKYDQRHHIIDDFEWFEKEQGSKKRCVYAYVDEDNKVAYVGLTVNKKERHHSHKTGMFRGKKTKSAVFDYFTSIEREVPEPIYLEDELTPIDAQDREDYWKKRYEDDGYTMLNKGVTGIGCGSLGNIYGKIKKSKMQEITIVLPSRDKIRQVKELGLLDVLKQGYIKEFTDLLSQKMDLEW